MGSSDKVPVMTSTSGFRWHRRLPTLGDAFPFVAWAVSRREKPASLAFPAAIPYVSLTRAPPPVLDREYP